MDLLEKSRRFFKFRWDKNWKFDFGHIKANNGTIMFQRPAIPETHRFTFNSVKSCKLWAYRFGTAMMEGFIANKRVDKNLYEVKTSALKIDDTEWSKIAKYMTNPDRFDRDNDIKVFESYLANNFRDRDGERFPKAVLKSFEKTIVGRSKLMGHKWGDPGNGRFYSAEIRKMGVEEALLFIGAQPDKNFKKHLEAIQERDGGIFWLVTRYYMPNITDMQKEAIIYIESGVWKDMSIGFRAPLKFAIFEDGKEALVNSRDFREIVNEDGEDNQVLFFEFRNDKDLEADALEGSHVWLGSQLGAQTTKSVDELENQIKELNGKLDKIISKAGRKKKSEEQSAVGGQQLAVEPGTGDGEAGQEIIAAENPKEETGNWVAVDSIEDEETKYFVQALDGILLVENEDFAKLSDAEKSNSLKAVWTNSYINTLQDDCFAYVEDTGKKDDEGRTIPKSARHLPHHPKGGGATDTGGIVDLPHLRNALARVNQVNPVTDKVSADRLRSLAKSHLVAHAKKLNIGDYELVYDTIRRNAGEDGNGTGDNDNSDKIITVTEGDKDVDVKVNVNSTNVGVQTMKEFKFESLGVNMTVSDEKFDENMKALHDALVEKETALNQEVADLTQKVSDFEDKAAAVDEQLKGLTEQVKQLSDFSKSVKDVFGDDVTIEALKRAKETEKAHREAEIKRSIKFGGLLGMIKDEKKELERYEGWTTDQISKFADKYEEDFYASHPEFAGVLKANTEELVTNSGNKPVEKPEIEAPLQHYRW